MMPDIVTINVGLLVFFLLQKRTGWEFAWIIVVFHNIKIGNNGRNEMS
jgi:hypothetical protein